MDENKDLTVSENETAVAPQSSGYMPTMWNDAKIGAAAWKKADALSKSDCIPDNYRGKVGNCLVAIDLANRMNLSPVTVMQYSQIVKGNFSWKGMACKALIDGSGKYADTEYVQVGDYGDASFGYYLKAIKRNGNSIHGPTVTVQMAIDEGWYARNPKWKTMTELMLKYRCASLFAKTECPSVLGGFQSAEEIQDVHGYEPEQKQTVVIEM